jgi:hypothetical protein
MKRRNSGNFKRIGAAAGAWLVALLSSASLAAQTTSAPTQPGGGWLLNQTNFIAPGDLPPHLDRSLQLSGARMTSADKALITLAGTTTDAAGSRTAQITIQAPGYLAYRETQGHAVGFSGTAITANSGALSSGDEAIAESLLAHFPDAVCLQVATGGSYRRIGSHFRPDGGVGATYKGPYWTLLAFAPKQRPGLTAGLALQQQLFVAVDDQTGFISEVRVVVSAGKQQTVTQTQFTNWRQQGTQWYPATITRLENGKQVLTFVVQTVSVGVAGPTTAFIP